MSLRNIAAVVAALGTIFVLAHWLVPSGSPGGFAFGEVQAQVAKTKTVQYVETQKHMDSGGREVFSITKRVTILGSHLKREEMSVMPGDGPKGEFSGVVTGDYTMIHDLKRGKMISLYPDKKGYVVSRGTLAVTDDGTAQANKIEPEPQVDFYKLIHDVPLETAKRVTDKQIGGKTAIGFEVVEEVETPRGTDTFARTYWVDATTKLPVRMEGTFRSTDPSAGRIDGTQSDFTFDAPLDESLFSTDPPPGYGNLADDKPASER